MAIEDFSPSEIYRWFDIFKNGKDLVELRLIANDGKTFSGYFSNAETMVNAISPYASFCNIYFTVNKVASACYSRPQKDKIIAHPKNTTTDSEIEGRTWVFIDLDAKRIPGVCASEDEITKVKKKANEVYGYLKSMGFNEPVVIFSSSGVHLYLKCNIAATPENDELIKRFTLSLGMLFSDSDVEVDPKVFNRGRIARLPGTYSRKGSSNDSDRPQRLCKFVKVPLVVKANDIEYFRKVASIYPQDQKPSRENNYSTERFDLEGFISKHNIKVTKIESIPGGKKYVLDHCFFNESHTGKDAVIFQKDSGEIAYHCFHAHCDCYKWQDVRLLFEPDAYDKKMGYAPQAKYRPMYIKPEPKIQVQDEEKGAKWIKMSTVSKVKLDPRDYIPSGYSQFDDLMIGFKRKHVSVWSGYRGSGKSSLLNMLILNAIDRGFKCALWTGELDDREVKTWLYLQAAGKQYTRSTKFKNYYYTPDDVVSKIDPWVDKYFWLYNNEYASDYATLELEITELVRINNVDMVFLDNLMILDTDGLGGDKYDSQKQLMIRLTVLAKRLNIHIHLVAHPNKSGNFLRPNNISGSGNIPDLAQNVFIIHRINRDFEMASKDFLAPLTIEEIIDSHCDNVVEICKCRDKGAAVDHFIKLYFEVESNRLKDTVAENTIYGWQDGVVENPLLPSAYGFSEIEERFESEGIIDDLPE